MEELNIINVLPLVLGGLIVFLYAIRQLSVTLRDIFSSKVENLIKKYTSNIFFSILLGVIVTILLDSSSAVIIITIIFINAGSLNFKQAMGIIMGANVGTTFSSQLIAFQINKYGVIALAIGFFTWLFYKSSKLKIIGKVVMYFGLLFFGLYILETSLMPFKNSEQFFKWVSSIDNPIKGVAIGGLVTLIIQSSSATVGILIIMAKQELINLSIAVSIMLGAELGTCSDTLVALVGGKRDAIRAGLFQILFNLIPIIIGFLVFDHFLYLVEMLAPKATISRQIANAHVLFSVFSVLLFLPFVNSIYRFINWIMPHKV
ncbi:Na/Pi cotransporter family protein [Pontimicrobium aquaticum]|uniref:Na/Pi cotransporter family protein n=1 Tax=Pontimicrobium aquaticum TaxID=2565367 RepID=A0A4V6WEA7_9FLAO|nr:Na/Pi symporter [Pontimicrobium aquaticum]TJY35759.1 Na/Pi cotransporter family protein [Pontimicrobium aquaticum]